MIPAATLAALLAIQICGSTRYAFAQEILDPVDCTSQCLDAMAALRPPFSDNLTATAAAADSDSNSWYLPDHLNPEYFHNYCRIFNETKDCLNSCEDSQITLLTLNILSVPRYACEENYKEMSLHIPCLHNVKHQVEKACSGNCSSVSNLTNDLLVETASFQQAFALACLLSHCQAECERPTIVSQCGEEAADLVQKMLVYSYQHRKTAMLSTRLLRTWPSECSLWTGTNDTTI